jgi:hypothetical protein
MTDYIDLEIGLRRDGDNYAVEFRCSQPTKDTDIRSGSSLTRFDFEDLLAVTYEDAEYGRLLTELLLARPEADRRQSPGTTSGQPPRAVFDVARGIAQEKNVPMRLRLFIGPNAPELHNLRWETLRDPDDGAPLLTDERVLFSRYLSSLDWSPVRLRRRPGQLRALVVIANPDLTQYPGLAQVDVEGELARAQSSLEDISVTTLASEGTATLRNIIDTLRDGYDVLYLVCHGALIKGEPKLWLEDKNGKPDVASGSELVARLKRVPVRPRLVVLASCESAGRGDTARAGKEEAMSRDGGALAALGPRLAEAGIPAVLAMQGNVTMNTAEEFMPAFFRELRRDGQIDRAMAAARSAVQDRADWWMPVLFMRLRSGRIWYTPGFTGVQDELEIWAPLLKSVENEYCTPILGPGLTEPLIGSWGEIARQWAETYRFPMAHHDREDLSRVAQYLAVHMKKRALWDEFEEQLCAELLNRYGKQLLEHYGDNLPKRLHELTKAVSTLRQEDGPTEYYQVLAELPIPLYITTDPSNLLEEALIAAGRGPQRKLSPWNDYIVRHQEEKLDHEPSFKYPLVYYLFGRLEEPRSLVLTEDDYYDFLIGITKNRKYAPSVVGSKLAENSLLFLGFRIYDRNFRALFRSVMNLEGRSSLGSQDEVANIAAQVEPEEGLIQEPERARRYLEKYFEKADISIYWGSVEDFIRELQRRW